MRKENFHEVSRCSNNVSNKYGHYGHQKIQLEPKTLGMPYCATGSSLTAVSHFRKSLKVVRGSFGPPSEYSSSLDLQRKSREQIVQQTARNKIRFQINQTNNNVVGKSQIWIPPGHAFFPRQDYSENRSETPLCLPTLFPKAFHDWDWIAIRFVAQWVRCSFHAWFCEQFGMFSNVFVVGRITNQTI